MNILNVGESMANAYIVARFTKVTHAFLLGIGNIRADKDTTWHAPIFDKNARIFTSKASADAYAKKMNNLLHNPPKRADGSFTLDISGYTDYKVIAVTKG